MFRVSKDWDFDSQCVPLPLASFMNLTAANPKIKICPGPEGEDILDLYNKYLGPFLADHCLELCEKQKFKYKGSMSASGPETTPIEVCYWIESNNILYSEEYLIYDLKVNPGSIGGMMSLLLGFIWNTTLRKLSGACKNMLRQ